MKQQKMDVKIESKNCMNAEETNDAGTIESNNHGVPTSAKKLLPLTATLAASIFRDTKLLLAIAKSIFPPTPIGIISGFVGAFTEKWDRDDKFRDTAIAIWGIIRPILIKWLRKVKSAATKLLSKIRRK